MERNWQAAGLEGHVFVVMRGGVGGARDMCVAWGDDATMARWVKTDRQNATEMMTMSVRVGAGRWSNDRQRKEWCVAEGRGKRVLESTGFWGGTVSWVGRNGMDSE